MITIEEAIEELKDASYSEARYGDKDNHRDKVMKRIEAFDMAIQVLEERLEIHDTCKKCVEFSNFEPQPCEDCISRAEVISGIDRYINKAQSIGTRDDFISFQELVVKKLPSVTPSISDVENNFDIGYNCGYTDAMIDIAEGSESE